MASSGSTSSTNTSSASWATAFPGLQQTPGHLYWMLHLVWLFPWSFFAPTAADPLLAQTPTLASSSTHADGRRRPFLLLILFAAQSLSFLPLHQSGVLHLPRLPSASDPLAAALTRAEGTLPPQDNSSHRWITFAYAALTVLGSPSPSSSPMVCGPPATCPSSPTSATCSPPRRGQLHPFHVGPSSTSPAQPSPRSVSPPALAALAFSSAPPSTWFLAQKAATSPPPPRSPSPQRPSLSPRTSPSPASPPCSPPTPSPTPSRNSKPPALSPDNEVLLYGDQAYGSSIPFYLDRRVLLLVDGRPLPCSSAAPSPTPHPSSSPRGLPRPGASGTRKILFVPIEKRDEVDHLLGNTKSPPQ